MGWAEDEVPFSYSSVQGAPSYPDWGADPHGGEGAGSGGGCPEAKTARLPGRYKLVELLCYVVMGFFPALVILSMVSAPTRPGASVWLVGTQSGSRDGQVEPCPLEDGALRPGVSAPCLRRQENVQGTPGLGPPVPRRLLSLLCLRGVHQSPPGLQVSCPFRN